MAAPRRRSRPLRFAVVLIAAPLFLLCCSHRCAAAAASAAAPAEDPQRVFSDIYARHAWGAVGGGSGLGSSLEYTRFTRVLLVHFLRAHNITSMLDAPCGSFLWMPAVVAAARRAAPQFSYTGLDVVESVVSAHSAKYANATHLRFRVADLTLPDALPRGMDLIFTRDALQHLSEAQIRAALRNVQAAAPRFFMAGSYLQGHNADVRTGDYFPIDLMQAPYSLKPDAILAELTPDNKHLYVYTAAQIAAWTL